MSIIEWVMVSASVLLAAWIGYEYGKARCIYFAQQEMLAVLDDAEIDGIIQSFEELRQEVEAEGWRKHLDEMRGGK